ncbi:hypothetical protein JET81_12470 [Pseudomonas aeruginosa]|nr:hypothetical protein [Pseudomonas aeruginosa]
MRWIKGVLRYGVRTATELDAFTTRASNYINLSGSQPGETRNWCDLQSIDQSLHTMDQAKQAPTVSGISKFAQLSAFTILGAVIGSGATAYTLQKVGKDTRQAETVEQVATTVEHSRIVNDEVLSRIKNVEAALDKLKDASTPILPPRQAQHQLDAAINGLFESIEDPEPIDNGQAQDAEAASGEVQMGDAAGDSAEDHEDGDAENASNEAGAEQKE